MTKTKGVKRQSQCQLTYGFVDHDEEFKVNSKEKEAVGGIKNEDCGVVNT